jgi:ABC-type phosphate/phosphonate transport system substrate-binding protein
MKLSKWSMLISILMVGAVLLSACGGGAETPAPEATEPPPTPTEAPEPAEPTATPVPPTPTPVPETPTPEPTPTPQGPPLGSDENPLVIAAVDVSGFMFHDVVTNLLAEETGFTVDSTSFASDAELADFLAGGATPDVIISFPGAYLVAHDLYGYEVALTGSKYGGGQTYTAEIIASADAGVTSLADAAGKSFCWSSPIGVVGYKVPRVMLAAAGVNPATDLGQESQVGTLDNVAQGVYQGDCQMGAIAGGGRSRLEDDFPDIMTKVLIVDESPPIPSICLSFAPGVSDEDGAAVIAGYRAVHARSGNDGAQALSMGYGWESVDDVEDSFFDPLRDLVNAAGLGMDALL